MEINYKLQTEKEEHKVYNKKVIKLKTNYKLKLNLPYWVDGFYLGNLFSTKLRGNDSIVVNVDQGFVPGTKGLNRRRDYYIYFPIYTISKCSDDDQFDETKGLHICETKAEIKALEAVRKFIHKIEDALSIKNSIISSLDKRINKNCNNLGRLCE